MTDYERFVLAWVRVYNQLGRWSVVPFSLLFRGLAWLFERVTKE